MKRISLILCGLLLLTACPVPDAAAETPSLRSATCPRCGRTVRMGICRDCPADQKDAAEPRPGPTDSDAAAMRDFGKGLATVWEAFSLAYQPGPILSAYLEFLKNSKGFEVIPKGLIAPLVLIPAYPIDAAWGVISLPYALAEYYGVFDAPAPEHEHHAD